VIKKVHAISVVFLPGFQKGRDIEASFRKRAGSSFGQEKGNLRRTRKNLKNVQISLLIGSIKCFPISFNTFKTF
jgi:hypothetical protein